MAASVCRAEAELAGAMEDVDARILRFQFFDDLPGSVRRVVVDHEDVGRGHDLVNLDDEPRDVPGLVVSGE